MRKSLLVSDEEGDSKSCPAEGWQRAEQLTAEIRGCSQGEMQQL